ASLKLPCFETVHRRSHTHSKPSGKRAPMAANGMPDQNKTRVSQMLTSRIVHHGGRPSAERKSEGSLRPRMMER
ncbi:hypothetical protein J6590_091105, partial [Homalodisca vitripennis]